MWVRQFFSGRSVALIAAAVAALAAAIDVSAQVKRPPATEALRNLFARPTSLPVPPDSPLTPAKVALGERLFGDPLLSGNGRISCATCHIPALAFSDGVPVSSAGATGRPLRRHTPPLWNLAWAPVLYWDGRAASLEDQASFPMSHADEMASSPEAAAARLAEVPAYRFAFAEAFGGEATITAEHVLKAIAAYERTLVSPPTRFDRWVGGDDTALSTEAVRGLRLFTGKAQCINCHSGFAFTDFAFHDIGLQGGDRGRGVVVGLAAIDFGFKTPSLRELTWTAPYMHDGKMATLDDVVRHYEKGGIARPSRSKDLPRAFRLSASERTDLIAFLESLSSDRAPKPSSEPWVRVASSKTELPASSGTMVSQRDRQFAPGAIRVQRGQTITVLNDDTRTHNISILSRIFRFNSGAQEPGEAVNVKLDASGTFEAHCNIHPTMRLSIEVD
jgi:cytochrome c peroxidase